MKKMRSILKSRLLEDQLPPPLIWAGPPPPQPKVVVNSSSRYTHKSIETLVVVLAVITIVGVIAGFVARLCGGRHLGDNGEYDIEGWVEKKCRSCLDAGVPPQPSPSPAAAPQSKPISSLVRRLHGCGSKPLGLVVAAGLLLDGKSWRFYAAVSSRWFSFGFHRFSRLGLERGGARGHCLQPSCPWGGGATGRHC